MKVLYDYPSVSMEYGGVARYVCEIIKELQNDIEAEASILVTDNVYIKELLFLKVKKLITSKNFKGKNKAQKFINTIYSNYKVLKNDFDVFHATYSDAYFLRKVKKPTVVTIHDMINEKLPEYHISHARHIENKKNLIYKSSHIIAVSENTKKDILEIYPVSPDKITVIHHGPPVRSDQVYKNEFGDYILYVGRRTRYKNFPFFVESIVTLLSQNPDLKLVCVGNSFTQDEKEFLDKLGVLKQASSIGVADDVLYSLYKNALVFVFPSIFEGFGIPILEAFANECPVCLSNSSCFPEIAGEAALYFDGNDSDSIRKSVERVINDKNLGDDLRRKGLERLSLFSWHKAAQETFNIYKKIAQNK